MKLDIFSAQESVFFTAFLLKILCVYVVLENAGLGGPYCALYFKLAFYMRFRISVLPNQKLAHWKKYVIVFLLKILAVV